MTNPISHKPAFIVVTGPDGSGKSTLLDTMKASRKNVGKSVVFTSIFSALSTMQGDGLGIDSVRRYMHDLSAPARWTFFLHALRHSCDLAFKQKPNTIFFDGYWYKYAISELALGLPTEFLRQASILLPKPDLVFYLDCPQELVWKRKVILGLTDYEKEISELDRQGRTYDLWRSLLRDEYFQSTQVVKLDAQLSPRELSEQVWSHIP